MTTTATAPLATRNEDYGFFGTMRLEGESPETAWDIASRLIADATDAHDGFGPEGVRDFLDSRSGRHFADMVADIIARRARQARATDGISLRDCIQEAITRHQLWTTDRQTEAEYGIPRGLPYLTGWVTLYAIFAEANDDA